MLGCFIYGVIMLTLFVSLPPIPPENKEPTIEQVTLTSVTLGAAGLFPLRSIAGLSGNNAISEITLSDGRVIRAVVFRINGQSIIDNQPYEGLLKFAPGRFNSIGPGRRDR